MQKRRQCGWRGRRQWAEGLCSVSSERGRVAGPARATRVTWLYPVRCGPRRMSRKGPLTF